MTREKHVYPNFYQS